MKGRADDLLLLSADEEAGENDGDEDDHTGAGDVQALRVRVVPAGGGAEGVPEVQVVQVARRGEATGGELGGVMARLHWRRGGKRVLITTPILDTTYWRLRHAALDQRRGLGEVIDAALDEWLARHGRRAA